jgi:hypothetical protein
MTVSIQMVSDNTQGVEEQARNATRSHPQQPAGDQAADEIRQIADSITDTAQVIEQLNQRSVKSAISSGDSRHCRPDQSAGAQCRHRSGTGGRNGTRLCRGGR